MWQTCQRKGKKHNSNLTNICKKKQRKYWCKIRWGGRKKERKKGWGLVVDSWRRGCFLWSEYPKCREAADSFARGTSNTKNSFWQFLSQSLIYRQNRTKTQFPRYNTFPFTTLFHDSLETVLVILCWTSFLEDIQCFKRKKEKKRNVNLGEFKNIKTLIKKRTPHLWYISILSDKTVL